MNLDERYNEVRRLHAGFVNALAIGAVAGGGFTALSEEKWSLAFIYVAIGLILHFAAADILERLRVTS